MKFGKVLLQSQRMSSSSWEAAWFDYKLLKKIIKDCAQIKKETQMEGDKLVKKKIKPCAREDNDSIRRSADEMNFFRTLRREIKKIADFFVKEQARYTAQVADIEAMYNELKLAPSEATKTEMMKCCVTMYKELLLLENFAVMNFCGVSKILKKHDKWTGYATRHKFMHTILMKQPFSTYCPLLQMINRLEQIFMESTGSSIDQHDSNQTNGEGSSDKTNDADEDSVQFLFQGSNRAQQTAGADTCSLDSNQSAAVDTGPGPTFIRKRSPRGDVTLVRVQSLRDDAKQLEMIERLSNDDNNDSHDDVPAGALGELSDGDEHAQVVSSPDSSTSPVRQAVGTSACSTEHRLEAEAMLSLAGRQDRAEVVQVIDSSTGAHISRLNKRKACSPLQPMEQGGKRKMSFATILN
ncbi:TPA: hypothetical protein N0F65_006972 [Lagenidium giganteum]|uniref:SPX domain-containing protein n=1 Tax=Lagenidium giganteum TaxID=4803 RepID=A0AAV2ZQ84_9STRA|nr:TPA: hypothetical protein N0F65_006972 [Lagenidium giganteum]